MGWATSSNVDTGNLDSGTDSPAAARADIKAAFDELKAVGRDKQPFVLDPSRYLFH